MRIIRTERILLTGATKFLGRHVLEEVRRRKREVACLVRPESRNAAALRATGVRIVPGDLNDPMALVPALKGFGSVIHVPNLASLTDPALLTRAYEDAGVERAVFVSSTGIFTKLDARTKPRRIAAERAIEASGLRYTILRPTLIYGTSEDGNIDRLLRFCRRSPVLPVFGSGTALQQPVHVEDVAWALVEVLGADRTERRTYNLGGGQTLTYNDLVRVASRELGSRTRLVHVPAAPAAFVARAAHRVGVRPPVSEEQILRLSEDKAYDIGPAERDFGFRPRSFEEGVRQQIEAMRSRAPHERTA